MIDKTELAKAIATFLLLGKEANAASAQYIISGTSQKILDDPQSLYKIYNRENLPFDFLTGKAAEAWKKLYNLALYGTKD